MKHAFLVALLMVSCAGPASPPPATASSASSPRVESDTDRWLREADAKKDREEREERRGQREQMQKENEARERAPAELEAREEREIAELVVKCNAEGGAVPAGSSDWRPNCDLLEKRRYQIHKRKTHEQCVRAFGSDWPKCEEKEMHRYLETLGKTL